MDAVRSSPKFWSISNLGLSRESPTGLTLIDLVIIVIASIIAIVSTRNYAGGYNDASRLASVESLVDHQTWKIDRSLFLNYAEGDRPEVWGAEKLSPDGRLDKLLIDGHYYSDKPPVLAVLMAADYQLLQWSTGLTAREHPNSFCFWMSLTTSGLSYVISVWALYRVGCLLALPLGTSLLITSSFGLATLISAYARQVNPNIVLLAISSLLVLVLLKGSEGGRRLTWKLTLAAGALAGFGYATDLGCGLVLLLCTALWVFRRSGYQIRAICLFGIAAMPFLAGHHALNYLIGGTFAPMNTVPEYFRWPNSPFSEKNLTGVGFPHRSVVSLANYAVRFLIGNKGFLYHNPELFLAIPAFFGLLRTPKSNRPLLIAFAGWAVGTWMLYSIKSNDFSGNNISIRWMVPTLIAGYLILAVFLRESPGMLREFLILSLFGVPIAAYDWKIGPWAQTQLWGFHAWIGLALVSTFVSYLARTGHLSVNRARSLVASPEVDTAG
jgi:hypothetical protein